MDNVLKVGSGIGLLGRTLENSRRELFVVFSVPLGVGDSNLVEIEARNGV